MATADPPTETLPIFDTSVFPSASDTLTIASLSSSFLRYPISQGSEAITGDLSVSGTSTLSGTTTINGGIFTQSSPQYKIDYPVNSGRFDFFANTAGGVSTRGSKIDATGVHTISKFDTIDETAGTLAIGTSTTRTGTINIGTGTSSKTINVGDAGGAAGATNISGLSCDIGGGAATASVNIANNGFFGGIVNIATQGSIAKSINLGSATGTTLNLGSTMTGGTINLKTAASSSGAINIGTGMTAGTIDIGQTANVASTTTTSIMNGQQQGGTLNICNGLSTSTAIDIAQGVSNTCLTRIGRNGALTINSSGTCSFSPCDPTQSLSLGQNQTTGTLNIGAAPSTRTGAISIGSSGYTSTLTLYGGTMTFGDSGSTSLTFGIPWSGNYNAGTFGFTSAQIGYQTTLTPTTTAIATGSATSMTGTFTLGNGVWMIVLTITSTLSGAVGGYFRMGISKTAATFENDRVIDFNPNTINVNNFTASFIVQSSSSTNWYVIGQQSGITTTIANTSIRVQQTRIA